ncbi:MAG: TonB-dependent receptor plug domain-containing protein, partial [Arenicella sp.]|nr:TonB-dependent receptor plug domain-containing protein [Arenicella sp.]
MKLLQPRITAIAFAVATLGGVSVPSFAQDESALEEIVTIGTRRAARSATDTPAPVDVISANDILDQASSDISDMIRTVVPSYQVNTQPISDAATLVRPANLRGLSPDNTLVLLNGKRRHRAAVISFLGGGISDGAHGADIGIFPAIGLKQVEVLRDGASSQYGSDAIAGVMNFVLKDDREGGSVELKWGSTYEGDGDNMR